LARPVGIDRGFVGRDGREIFNRELAEIGFVTDINAPAWGVQFGPRHRLALIESEALDIGDGVAGAQIPNALASRVGDLLALTNGGAPRLLAGVTEVSDDEGAHWRTLAIMAGSGPFPGSILESRPTGGQPIESLDTETLWTHIDDDPRVPLWLSLYRGIAAEPSWDVRVFRACSLLEAVAHEVFPSPVQATNEAGEQLLDYGGHPATTRKARGAIYMLSRRCLEVLSISDDLLLAHDNKALWDEVGVWVDVRNAVAHEGRWLPHPSASAKPNRQERVAAAFDVAGLGDGVEAGSARYAAACAAGVEVVLRAAAAGLLRS
jgi:hypothetical protein